MYPKELEIKEKLEKASSLPFLEIYLKFYINAQLSTRLYDKRDHFNFAITILPHLDSTTCTQSLPHVEAIFHNSYATLELAVYFQTFYNVGVFWV
jgi:hypothetical protein